MTTQTDALHDLKSEILEQGYSESLIQEIADEYSLHPLLLTRLFKAWTGQRPEKYAVRTDLPDGATLRREIDDLERMCWLIAKEFVGHQIKRQGLTVKAYKEIYGGQAFEKRAVEASKHTEIIKLAKDHLALELDMLSITI